MKQVINKRIRIRCALLLVLSIVVSIWNPSMTIYAVTDGVVVCMEGFTVNTRQSASTDSEIVNRLANGKPLSILEETTGKDGYKWYKVSYVLNATKETKTAYIRSDFVQVSGKEQADPQNPGTTDTTTGVSCRDNVFVRNEPGTVGTYRILSLYIGDPVTIVGQTTVDGALWYHVCGTKDAVSFDGWAYGEYISVTSKPSSEEKEVEGDYAKTLREAGFPESYIASLVTLHEKYPEWKFEPVQTGLDWSTAVAMESMNGRNLVQMKENDAKKSTATGAYNWFTNTWTIYDGSTWVSANTDYIAYCMDPRNFLNEDYIFMFEGLSYNDNQTLQGVQSILSGTFMMKDIVDSDGSTLKYAESFLEIGRKTGVSPYHLAARVRQEQGTSGTNAMIAGTYKGYEGYYNYFNYGAYGSTATAVLRTGLIFAKTQGWSTRLSSLSGGAKLLATNYISKGQDTIYFQKFNVVNKSNLYSHQYMANVAAAMTEGKKLGAGYANKNQSFVFRIPIYKNMPTEAVSFTATGNPNNYLKDLKLEGISLTPAFSGATTSYSAVVDSSVKQITVTANAVAATSKVSGTGVYELKEGTNRIEVTCTAKNQTPKVYAINVVRTAENQQSGTNEQQEQPPQNNAGQEENVVSEPSFTSKTYQLGDYVTGISPQTEVGTFTENISVTDGSVKVLQASGAENAGIIATGDLVVIYDQNGNQVSSYPVVVYGDINGDGAVNALDMIKLNRYIIGQENLSGAYLEAADANRKGDGVNALDMIILNRHILGSTTIEQ